ncbi:polymorphic toxin-type HINT domain-containing protein [Roseateles sp. BYS96W]|uniref:Polymorphic toxin-type HINT domain-containing protein n=1 Tax=Pelomonas nitida TaxID=3299027 RepID=A0ABW7G8T4_9BURK
MKGRFEQGIVIDVTGNHPIWVVGKGWIEARELIEGDELYSADGKPVSVISLTNIDHSNDFVVYNLEVEGFNTYFVSAEYIWVHNCNLQTVGVKVADVVEGQVPKEGKYSLSDPREINIRNALKEIGVDTEVLPDPKNHGTTPPNKLGKKEQKNPDLLDRATGEVIELYRPETSGENAARNAASKIQSKAWEQSSVLAVDLRNSSINPLDLLKLGRLG